MDNPGGIPKHLQLEFVTPERTIAQADVDEVVLPGEEGSFGVLPGHAPFLTSLLPGTIWYRQGNEKSYAFIARGFAEVLPDRVVVLAQVAERAEDIDAERAEAAKRRAEERLQRREVDIDFERVRFALVKALARLDAVRHIRRRG